MHHAHNTELDSCIEACLDCYRHCQRDALTVCLELGGKHIEPAHLRLMFDCAEACRSAAALMVNGSPYHTESCGLCASICGDCARSCRDVGSMDGCVEACQRCAESCAAMAGAARAERKESTSAAPAPHRQ